MVVLDKTGTITRGEPAVTDVVTTPDYSQDEVLRLAASAERGSEHPLGRAIVAAGKEKGLLLVEPDRLSGRSAALAFAPPWQIRQWSSATRA